MSETGPAVWKSNPVVKGGCENSMWATHLQWTRLEGGRSNSPGRCLETRSKGKWGQEGLERLLRKESITAVHGGETSPAWGSVQRRDVWTVPKQRGRAHKDLMEVTFFFSLIAYFPSWDWEKCWALESHQSKEETPCYWGWRAPAGFGVRKRPSSLLWRAWFPSPFAVSYKFHMYMLGNSLHMSWFLLHTKH